MSSRNEEIKWSNLQIGNEKFPYQNQKNCTKKSKVPTLPSSKEYIIVIVLILAKIHPILCLWSVSIKL